MDKHKELKAQTTQTKAGTMRNLVYALCFLLFQTIIISCSHSGEISDYHAVDASGWNYGDTVFFDLQSPDSVFSGDLSIAVRHSADYGYSNIWLEIIYPPQDSIKPDTVNLELADVYGNWHGKGLGLSFQHVDSVKSDVDMTLPKRIGVRHIMRIDRLEGIEQLGLILKPDGK